MKKRQTGRKAKMGKHVTPGRVPEPLILIRAHFYTSHSGCSASGRSRHSAAPRFCLRFARRDVTKCHVLSRHVTKLPYASRSSRDMIKMHLNNTGCPPIDHLLSTYCPFPLGKRCDNIIIAEGCEEYLKLMR